MGETEVSHDLTFNSPDGRKFNRIEMEQQIRDKWKHWSIKKLRANREYGLQNKVAQDMTPGMLLHWLLDEMIRKSQIDGDVLGISVTNYNDPNEKAQLLQRLTALIQAGQALKPKTGEGLDMTMPNMPPPPPAPPGPPPQNGQAWAPPPGFPQPPAAAAPQYPQQPQYAPPAPPGPPPGYAPAAPGYPPPPPMASAPPPPPPAPGYGPPPGAPPPPPGPPQQQFATPGFPPPPGPAAPPAPTENAGRRKRGSTQAQGPAVPGPAAPVPGAPMPMAGPPPMPGQSWGGPPAPPQQQYAGPNAGYPAAQPPQSSNEVAELKAMVTQLTQQIHALARQINMISSLIVLGNRAIYNAQGGWDIEERLRELNGPIPPQ